MRAVEEVQAQVSRVEKETSGRLIKDGVRELSWLQVGRRKRSPEKGAGRPHRRWCGIQQQTKNFFLFHSNKRHCNKLCKLQTRHQLSNNLLVQGTAHNSTSFTNFLPGLLGTSQPCHSHCPAFPEALSKQKLAITLSAESLACASRCLEARCVRPLGPAWPSTDSHRK